MMQVTETTNSVPLSTFGTAQTLDIGSLTSTGSITFGGVLKTPKVITVSRGSDYEAICVDTFDANGLPVTRCETLSTIGVPPEIDTNKIQGGLDMLGLLVIASMLIGVLVNVLAVLSIRRKGGQ